MPALRIDNLQKSFGSLPVLKGVDLSVESGETVAVIGRSGSGKSTMLRCINGLEPFNSGSITVVGHKLELHQQTSARLAQGSWNGVSEL
jgi:polar amino acid transport system ATP-binding protein